MAEKKTEKAQLMADIRDAGRQLSGITIRFHHLVSEKIGLAGGDHKYLDLLLRHGSMPAGRLSELSGLTTGAVTALLDRLEQQNFIKRERDPADRRKVIVVPNQQLAMERLGPIFETLQVKLSEVDEKFTNEQLQTIYQYMENSTSVFSKMIDELKEQ